MTGDTYYSPVEQKRTTTCDGHPLIDDFEAKHCPIPDASPVAIVRHLMEAHNLRQKDLLDVFSTESIASEVLHGKRELTRDHIRRLSARFGVSPAVFF